VERVVLIFLGDTPRQPQVVGARRRDRQEWHDSQFATPRVSFRGGRQLRTHQGTEFVDVTLNIAYGYECIAGMEWLRMTSCCSRHTVTPG